MSIPRKHRVRKSWQYQRIKQIGKRVHTKHFIMQVAPSTDSDSRLGVIVTKKIGNAVCRNRIKRLVKEVFRKKNEWISQQIEIVCVAKSNSEKLSFVQIEAEIQSVQHKLSHHFTQAQKSNPNAQPSH